MTDKMITFLTRASGTLGVTSSSNAYYEAYKNGWLKSIGAPQNSTTTRYVLTDAGRAALTAAL